MDNLRSGFQGISLLLCLVFLWVNHLAQPRRPYLASRTSGPCQNWHTCYLYLSVYSFSLEDRIGTCLEILLDEQGGYTSLRTLGREGPCPLRHTAGPSGPPKEELRQALPVWLLLWTMSTLGPMQMIPQTSHFSLPLGSRMPPAPDKALLPWTLCEPFIFSPEASSIRKSSAHSSPFTSQARPFSSSL